MRSPETIYTLGHSTRPIDQFIALLKRNRVKLVVDVRTIPRSRFNPQFGGGALKESLKQARISYRHLPELGGLRKPLRDSPNTGWRNASFRGYADYMQSAEFRAALEKLIALAGKRRTAIVCAEALPWRCHRSLIADALGARRIRVEHILGGARNRVHKLTPFAQVKGTKVTYPEPTSGRTLLAA